MELTAKIILFAVSWYAIGFAAMHYIRWEFSKDPNMKDCEITHKEVYVLGLLGLIVVLQLIWAKLMFWWYER